MSAKRTNQTIPTKVGKPPYVIKAEAARREQYETARKYVDDRDKMIADEALKLSKRTAMTYEEAHKFLCEQWAAREQEEGVGRKVRALALGYDEVAQIARLNAKLNARSPRPSRAARRRQR